MLKRVEGHGNKNAKLAVVGEAPGEHEADQGLNFVGQSGQLVDGMLYTAGVPRDDVWLTNVVKVHPPGNDLRSLPAFGYSVDQFIPELREELRAINPNCVIALGSTALSALTNVSGITKYRGSILLNKDGAFKVVPTIHPASILHQNKDGMNSWKQLFYIQFDFKRAVEQSKFEEYNVPQRNLWVCKNSLDLWRYLNRNQDPNIVTIDVETFRTIPLCVGLAFNKSEAVSIPLFNIMSMSNPTGQGISDLCESWKMLADFLEVCNANGQNLKFDCHILEDVGLRVTKVAFDTLLAFGVLYPEFPKSLQFQTSILTEEPYYKDEGREYNPKKDKLDRLLLYNARDAVVEHEIMEVEKEELKETGLEDFFYNKQLPLHNMYYRLEKRGIRFSNSKRSELKAKYETLRDLRQKELDDLIREHCGLFDSPDFSLNVMSNAKQVPIVLFEYLKIPKRKDVGEETLIALINNVIKDTRRKRILELVIEVRQIRRVLSAYINAKDCSKDEQLPRWVVPGRYHTQVRICGTESGRTSNTKLEPPVSPEILGLPFQQISKHEDLAMGTNIGTDLREMFISDEGKTFIEADYSGGESRVTCHLAYEPHPDHRTTASWLFELPESMIDDEMRQLGKQTRHAGGYGMGKRRLAQLAAVYGIRISEYRAGICLQKFHDHSPGIQNVYWKEVREALENSNNILWTPLGRRRQFFERWGEELFKEAYSYIPQSTITDMTKFAMLRIEKRAPWIEFLQEGHDSFLAQVWDDMVDDAIAIILGEMQRPIDFSRCSLPRDFLLVPVEVKIGKCWKGMEKYAKSSIGVRA